MKLFENLSDYESQSDNGKNILKQLPDYDERSINKGQPIYDEISHNVVYLFSIYDEITHNVVYLFSTPNLGSYRANMTIPRLALNQSKLLKYFQYIIMSIIEYANNTPCDITLNNTETAP